MEAILFIGAFALVVLLGVTFMYHRNSLPTWSVIKGYLPVIGLRHHYVHINDANAVAMSYKDALERANARHQLVVDDYQCAMRHIDDLNHEHTVQMNAMRFKIDYQKSRKKHWKNESKRLVGVNLRLKKHINRLNDNINYYKLLVQELGQQVVDAEADAELYQNAFGRSMELLRKNTALVRAYKDYRSNTEEMVAFLKEDNRMMADFIEVNKDKFQTSTSKTWVGMFGSFIGNLLKPKKN